MKFRGLFISALFLLISASASAQCALCAAAANSGTQNGQHIAGGINNAILYMMVFPYILLFVFFRKKIIGFIKELRGLPR